ncbi:MAG TPA: ABC-F family ATP-binding cassette domain-containing protein [Longimicrobiales bacterium]
MSLLTVAGVTVHLGGAAILQDVSFTIGRGERWGVVGRNGSGKTTLFHLLTGRLEPFRGSVARLPGLRVSLLDQHREFDDAVTVWDAAALPFAELRELERSLAEQAAALADDPSPKAMARYDRDLERFQREGGYTYAARVDAVLHGLGFDPDAARRRPLAALSGGERGRIGLARQLVAPADVFLLDEPTNHLDLETTRWLEEYLRTLDATVLVISHDRAFLDAIADHVLHIENGTATPYAGGYASFVTQRAERRLAQQRAFDQQQRRIAAEEEYIRRNIAGQNSRQARGRRTRLARIPRLSPPPSEEAVMALRLRAAERGGDQVLVADDVRLAVHEPVPTGDRRPADGEPVVPGGFTAGERYATGARSADAGTPAPAADGAAVRERVLIEGFSTRLTRGEVVGLVGPNGAGKSTLLRAIVGEHPVADGELKLGASIRVAYYRQDLAQIPAESTLFDAIHDLRPQWDRGQVQGHLGRFGFSGDEVQRRAGTLSGGEQARLALAMIMLSGANLLIFDEPTNHLDVETIEALEDAIEAYDGTVLLVSHDRALLRALTTRVWALRDGRIESYDGGFDEWEALQEERARADAAAAAAEEAARRERARRPPARRTDDAAERERRAALREARRRVESLETRVAELEARAAGLTAALEDPTLYETAEGSMRSHELKAELDAVRAELDRTLEEWAEAGETAEALAGG